MYTNRNRKYGLAMLKMETMVSSDTIDGIKHTRDGMPVS